MRGKDPGQTAARPSSRESLAKPPHTGERESLSDVMHRVTMKASTEISEAVAKAFQGGQKKP
jgi:hypothetical protein